MDIRHKRLLYLQVLLLICFICTIVFRPHDWRTYSVFGYVGFYLLELAVLRFQGREPSQNVLYRKSCFFALLDLLTVLIFCCSTLADLFSWIWTFPSYNPGWLIPLFLYIAVRKIYIMKNYSYEI